MRHISLKLILAVSVIMLINSCGELENTASFTDTDIIINQNSYIVDDSIRFSRDEINNLVVDNNSKIVWQDNKDVISLPKTFQESQEYCSSLDTLNLNWRLPTITELSSIILDSSKNSHTNMTFKNTRGAFYFSSTKFSGNTSSIWGVHFRAGFKIWIRESRKSFIRCVANL